MFLATLGNTSNLESSKCSKSVIIPGFNCAKFQVISNFISHKDQRHVRTEQSRECFWSNASQINGLVRWRDLCLASQSEDAKRQPANCAFEQMGVFTGALSGKTPPYCPEQLHEELYFFATVKWLFTPWAVDFRHLNTF